MMHLRKAFHCSAWKKILIASLFIQICAHGLLQAQTTIPGGYVYGTWTLAGSPYLVTGAIRVPSDSTLTIQPGVSVSFQGSYKFEVMGRLLAQGTVTDSIHFTGLYSPGWRGLRFDGTPMTNDSSKFRYCIVDNAIAANCCPGNDAFGGGFYFNGFSKAVISNCRISNNTAYMGGGIAVGDQTGMLVISNNTISHNTAFTNGGGIYTYSPLTIQNNLITNNSGKPGGGIHVAGNGQAVIRNNTISYNQSAGSYQGGGIYIEAGGPNEITGNTITYNTAGDGDGIYLSNTSTNIRNNIIANNKGDNGGNMRGGGGILVVGSSTTFIADNLIVNNYSIKGGGLSFLGNSPFLVNNTIAYNDASEGGGLYCSSASPVFKNCLVWENIANSVNNQVSIYDGGSHPSFYYSDVQGGSAAFTLNGNFYAGPYLNNQDANPHLVTPPIGPGIASDGMSANWMLQSSSACIDAGTPDTTGLNIGTTDKAGNSRVVGCRIDIGAYEFQNPNAFSASVTQTAITCHGLSDGQLHVNATGAGSPYKYSWSTGDTTASIINLAAGNYSVTATNSLGCSLTIKTVLSQPAVLSLTENHTNASCSAACNGSATINASGGTVPYTYSWNGSASNGPVCSNLCTGTYTITVTDTAGCNQSKVVTITAGAGMTINETHSNVSCHATCNGAVSLAVSGGAKPYTYSWNAVSCAGSSCNNLCPGSYTVSVTDAVGCNQAVAVGILAEGGMTVSETHTDASCSSICNGSATITAMHGTGGYTYSWINSHSCSGPSCNTLCMGIDTVRVTDSLGCTIAQPISVGSSPPIAVTTKKNDVKCFGSSSGSIQVKADSSSGALSFSDDGGLTFQASSFFGGLMAGNYTVVVRTSVGCLVNEPMLTISQPASALKDSLSAHYLRCYSGHDSVTAWVQGGIPPYTYSWNTVPPQTTRTATNLPAGNYELTVTDSNACVLHTYDTIATTRPALSICMVTVDSLSKNNLIIWSKAGFAPSDTFIVYRDIANNNYVPLAKIPYTGYLSQFVDTVRSRYAANGDPNTSSWRYKLAVKDSCGSTSPLSPFHQTIFMQDNGGNFNWTQYLIEGQPVPVPGISNYVIMRDNTSTGNFLPIQTLSASSSAYTDPQYTSYQNTGSWRVKTIWNISCDPTFKTSYATTLSNIRVPYKEVGIQALEFSNAIHIYPNPASGLLHLEFPAGFKTYRVRIYTMLGAEVYNGPNAGEQQQIDICALPAGMYTIAVETEDLKAFRKIVVE